MVSVRFQVQDTNFTNFHYVSCQFVKFVSLSCKGYSLTRPKRLIRPQVLGCASLGAVQSAARRNTNRAMTISTPRAGESVHLKAYHGL